MSNLPRNVILLYIYQVVGGMLFFLPIIALYLEENLGTLTNVAIVFSIQAVAIAVFEVPSGAFADLFGRKRSIVLANLIVLAAIFFLYLGGSLVNFIIFAILNALGRSLVSGTENALLYDTLNEHKRQKEYKKMVGRMYALWPAGAIIGSVIGGYLASIHLGLAVILSTIPVFVCLILALLMREAEYDREKHKNVALHILNSSGIVFKNHQLLLLFGAGIIMWGIGESIHHFNSVYFELKTVPLVYFGITIALIFGLSSIGHFISSRVSDRLGDKQTLIIAAIGSPIFIILSTMYAGYVSIALFIIPSIFFGLRRPVIDHLINEEVKSSKRATIVSINNFFGYLGFALYSLLLGSMSDEIGLNIGYRISAILLLSVPIILLFLKKRARPSP